MRLRQVNIGKADVQAGLDFILLQLRNLVGNELADVHGLLSDGEHSLRPQYPEIRLVDLQKNLLTRGDDILLFGFSVFVRAFDQFVCAAEVGDQLVDGEAVAIAIKNAWGCQCSGADARVILRIGPSGTPIYQRVVSGSRLRHLCLSGIRQISGRLNLRMILKRDLLSVVKVERLRPWCPLRHLRSGGLCGV